MAKENKKEEYKIFEQDKFLAKNRSKFEKKGVDREALKAKKTTVAQITKDINFAPEKLHVVNALSKPSAKPAASGENPLQSGEAK